MILTSSSSCEQKIYLFLVFCFRVRDMANFSSGRVQFNVRMKPADVDQYRQHAQRVGYPTANILAAKILEETLHYLSNPEQIKIPDILFKMKTQKPLPPFANPPAPATQKALPFTPEQLALIEAMMDAREKKIGASAPSSGRPVKKRPVHPSHPMGVAAD
jgi:hypothetical protein